MLATGLATAGGLAYYLNAPVEKQFELASASGGLLRRLDPEVAHKAGVWAAKMGLFPRDDRPDPKSLRTKVWGRTFPNCIGALAAPHVLSPLMLCYSVIGSAGWCC